MSLSDQVEILLATFNGEAFLREQIDSLLGQTGVDVRILARDDGSTDSTVAILREYEERFPDRFRLLPQGPPTGHARLNFLRLLEACTGRYVCLSDQDDVWQPDKVALELAAMRALEPSHSAVTPLLVFTDLQVVDEQLRPLFSSFWKHEGTDPNAVGLLRKVLVQNVLTGCTAMLNRPLVELTLSMPVEAPMHDRWIALLAAALGASQPLNDRTVRYRQHRANVIGASRGGDSVTEIVTRAAILDKRLGEWQISQALAAALLRLHGERMEDRKRGIVEAYLGVARNPNRIGRVASLIRHGFFRHGVLRNLSRWWDVWNLKPNR